MRISDWSSDVCSSDLQPAGDAAQLRDDAALLLQPRGGGGAGRERRPQPAGGRRAHRRHCHARRQDRKSVVKGKSESVRVDLGVRRIIKTKNTKRIYELTIKTL